MIKIYYSHTPFWRAEVLRVSLFIKDIPFEDIRVSREEFVHLIKTGILPNGKRVPFHQLPVIEVDGKQLVKQERLQDIAVKFPISILMTSYRQQKLIR